MVAPSESLDCLDLVESVEPESDGVENDRSSGGTASRASDGETLGEGEAARCNGEVFALAGTLTGISVLLGSICCIVQVAQAWHELQG